MMQLSAGEILQLSPDEASAKAAKSLVIPGKWPRLEYNEQAIWGECQGSGSKPYQVQVDKSGPAFRCSCPSRKFPCKHGLALLLLQAQNPANFSAAPAPAWVAEWLASRQQRAEKQEARIAEQREAPPDPQAAARREETRRQRMAGGLDELERWLNDRLRQGLAQLPGQMAIWEDLARRMIDAQLPGLAYRLRQIAARVGRDEAWPGHILGGLGQLRLLIDAFRRLDSLPAAIQQDVRSALGLSTDRDSVLANGERLRDDWQVLGQAIDEENNLWSRRVWLLGRQTQRPALLLDFAHGSRRFEQNYVTASSLHGELAFFPGNLPLRALNTGDTRLLPNSPPPVGQLEAALEALTRAVAANPWQAPLPMLVDDGVPGTTSQGWSLHCPERRQLPLHLRDEDGWQLLAVSGGAPLTVFGEWNGEALRPLAAWQGKLLWQEETESA
jgi:hypothetical protein